MGTYLCMVFLNPELKLKSIKRKLGTTATLDITKDKTCKQEINDFIGHIKASGKTFDYLEWSKASKNRKAVKVTTYHSKKCSF